MWEFNRGFYPREGRYAVVVVGVVVVEVVVVVIVIILIVSVFVLVMILALVLVLPWMAEIIAARASARREVRNLCIKVPACSLASELYPMVPFQCWFRDFCKMDGRNNRNSALCGGAIPKCGR